jgi:N-acetylglucosamine kinase-like BadF-type ATPase
VKIDSCRIGVDGGATKTECILVDAHGTVIARHTAPGCNPSVVGPDRARATLLAALHSLAPRVPSPVSGLLLCMAGSPEFWRETAAGLDGFGRVETAPDSLPVLELATAGAPGLVLHAGTGSFVAARAPDGSLHYAGGLGWRFDDAGSGYDLGRRAIARALAELQGWTTDSADGRPGPGTRSPLAAALCAHTGAGDYGTISRLFYSDAADVAGMIAGFAPQVIALAEHHDATAAQIVAESLAGFAPWVNRVLGRVFPGAPGVAPSLVPCGVSGALLNRPPCWQVLQALAAAQAWPVRLQSVREPPIEGVRRLLVKLA